MVCQDFSKGAESNDALGNLSFSWGCGFSLRAALGGWTRKLCAFSGVGFVWFALFSASMELGGADVGSFGL